MSGLQARISIQRTNLPEGFRLDLNLAIPDSGITAILGRSGSGKTTLLRCIAGLEPAVQGSIAYGDELWWDSEARIRVPCHRRRLAYVFEEGRLFPHLNVAENLDARGRGRAAPHPADRVRMIELLQIDPLLQRNVAQLSAGERQRVAIGRALLSGARLVLMDEPLSGLDHRTREPVLHCLENLHRELSVPVLYVTHSLTEVARLADRLVVLENGRVAEQGPAADLFADPNSYVSRGDDPGVFLSCTVASHDAGYGLSRLSIAGISDQAVLWVGGLPDCPGTPVRVRIRAGDVSLSRTRQQESSILNQLPAVIDQIEEPDQASVLVRLRLHEQFLLARVTRRSMSQLRLDVGSDVFAQVKSVSISDRTLVREDPA